MRSPIQGVGILVVCSLGIANTGWAQTGDSQLGWRQNYNVQSMNFDLWCQETRRYPVDRCDARLPEDQREFEDYRALIERYEMQYLMEQKRNAEAAESIDRNYSAPWERYSDPRGR